MLLALLVLTRALLVLALADVFSYGEELGKGAAAKAMLDDLGVEHWKLNYVYHEGGGFVVTHLKALAFLLVGESVLAHKLVALSTSALTLAAGFLLLTRHFGVRAAVVFGLLFVLAPAAFLRFSLLSLGTHFEALLFLALVAHLTLRITESASPRPREFLLLGLSGGFGLYFSLQAVPAIAASGLYLLLRARSKLAPQGVALALFGFLLGVAPWIYMISKVGMDAIRVRGSEIAGKSGTTALDSLAFLFEPLQSQGDSFDWAALVLYPLVIGLGFVRLPPELVPTRRRAALVALLLAIFVGAYVASGLAIASGGHWFFFLRLSTFWFFANVLFAAAVGNLLARRAIAPRAIAIAATAVLVVAGVVDLVAVVRTGSPGAMTDNARTLAMQKGYDYAQYFDKFKTHLEGGEVEKIAVLMRFDDDPELLLPAISHSLFERSPLALEEVLAIARASFGEAAPTGLRGIGTYLAPDGRYDVAGAFAGIEGAPEETRAALAEAIGRTGYGLRITPERIEREISAEVDPALRPAFLRGTGARLYAYHLLHGERALERIEREAEPVRGWLRAGFDAAASANTLR